MLIPENIILLASQDRDPSDSVLRDSLRAYLFLRLGFDSHRARSSKFAIRPSTHVLLPIGDGPRGPVYVHHEHEHSVEALTIGIFTFIGSNNIRIFKHRKHEMHTHTHTHLCPTAPSYQDKLATTHRNGQWRGGNRTHLRRRCTQRVADCTRLCKIGGTSRSEIWGRLTEIYRGALSDERHNPPDPGNQTPPPALPQVSSSSTTHGSSEGVSGTHKTKSEQQECAQA